MENCDLLPVIFDVVVSLLFPSKTIVLFIFRLDFKMKLISETDDDMDDEDEMP